MHSIRKGVKQKQNSNVFGQPFAEISHNPWLISQSAEVIGLNSLPSTESKQCTTDGSRLLACSSKLQLE